MEGEGGRCDFRGDVGWRGMELELGMVGAKTGSQGMEEDVGSLQLPSESNAVNPWPFYSGLSILSKMLTDTAACSNAEVFPSLNISECISE